MLDLQHPGSDLAGRSEDCKLLARRRGPGDITADDMAMAQGEEDQSLALPTAIA